MRIGLITQGTRGDIQPFISLAIGLMERGHYIRMFAPENYKDFIEGFNIAFSPMVGNIEELMYHPNGLRLLKGGNLILLAIILERKVMKFNNIINKSILDDSADLEFLISTPGFSFTAYSIAEKYDKKYATIALSMPATATKEFPFQMFDFFNNPWYNKFSYKIMLVTLWVVLKKRTNNFRRMLKLPLINLAKQYVKLNVLTLYPMSKYLIAQPRDWPSNAHVTGFFSLPESARIKMNIDPIPKGMEDWIGNGGDLIYVGFGSIPVPDEDLLNSVLLEICSKTKYRIVYCTGWSRTQNLPIHPKIYITKYINHDWLLPKCDFAIIHGGIGTIAAVLKAKIPMIIFSIFADQPINGKMIVEKKLGVHFPFRKVTPQKVLKAINIVQSPELRKNAAETGEKINTENGVEEAIEKIEKYIRE